VNKYIVFLFLIFIIFSCIKQKNISLDSKDQTLKVNVITNKGFFTKTLSIIVTNTENYYNYHLTNENKSMRIQIPSNWTENNDVFDDDNNKKIGEISGGYILTKDINLKNIEKKIIETYKIKELEIFKTKIYKAGKYDVLKVITHTFAETEDGKGIEWYPSDYYIVVNDQYLFGISFYEMSEKLENSTLFDKIIENMVFFDQIK
jgi:hypothetical protein